MLAGYAIELSAGIKLMKFRTQWAVKIDPMNMKGGKVGPPPFTPLDPLKYKVFVGNSPTGSCSLST